MVIKDDQLMVSFPMEMKVVSFRGDVVESISDSMSALLDGLSMDRDKILEILQSQEDGSFPIILDKKIMLSQNENFIVYLLVDRVSSFLWSALDSFATMFNLKYGLEDQEYAVVTKNIFDDAETLLKIAFGRQ